MLKHIVSMFGSLGWMIVRVMLTIASLVGAFYCGFTAARVPFRWAGALHLLGALGCAAVFMLMVTMRRKDEDEDGTRPEDR